MNQTTSENQTTSVNSDYSRILTYQDLVLANIGYLIGVGIFVLIGKTLNIAGSSAWISVILSGLFIYFISNSYIKAHDIYKTNDSEILAISNKFGASTGSIISVIILVVIILIAFLGALAFGSYTEALTNNFISAHSASLLGLVLAGGLNISGIKLTVEINKVATISGIIGLLIIIFLGLAYISKNFKSSLNNMRITEFKPWSILYGAFIFVFAYTGFELIIRLNKESVDAANDIPDAIQHSIIITIILYTIICIVMIAVFDSHMDITDRPFANLVEKLTSNKYIIKYIEFCGSILTWTTILFSITQSSRILREFIYSATTSNNQLSFLSNINEYTGTPVASVLLIILSLLMLLSTNLNIINASIITNSGLVITMCLVFASVFKF